MTIKFITFSDTNMMRSAGKCLASALVNGADEVRLFTKEDVQEWYVCKSNPDVFRQPEDVRRAWAWWAWKPLIIKAALSEFIGDGDYLIYSDAGVEVIGNLKHIVDRMDQDVWLFGNNWEHAHWCKRDVIDTVWPTPRPVRNESMVSHETRVSWVNFGKQAQATVIAFRVSWFSRVFILEWLARCLQAHLIDDSPSIAPNHPEFREHRHDQAILTTMAYREGIKLHYWPASYNDGAFNYEKLPEYAGDDYPILFNHHRFRDVDWEQKDRTRNAA